MVSAAIIESTSTSYENPMMASSLGNVPKLPSFDLQSAFVGALEGTEEGALEGLKDGSAEGTSEGSIEGEFEGLGEGSTIGMKTFVVKDSDACRLTHSTSKILRT